MTPKSFNRFFNQHSEFGVVAWNVHPDQLEKTRKIARDSCWNLFKRWDQRRTDKKLEALSAILRSVLESKVEIGPNNYLGDIIKDAEDMGLIEHVELPKDKIPQEYLRDLLYSI